ncbi:hypothetical protein [Tenacibaculum maritimum]|uniref:hypothetical protein n=1 Tax=Tenacibaculum maritimum TaxID=107401 RepID=UPI0038776FE1
MNEEEQQEKLRNGFLIKYLITRAKNNSSRNIIFRILFFFIVSILMFNLNIPINDLYKLFGFIPCIIMFFFWLMVLRVKIKLIEIDEI